VYLLHHVDRNYFPRIVNKATLYLVSSGFEQYSISIIEAMAQGVPFISTNVGNARFLPGGVTLASPNEMHTAIDRLLTDGVEYARLSHAGKEFAYTNCRIDVAVDKLEKILMA
jgi:glycosyltransferase involved in cell wall biosynthesis